MGYLEWLLGVVQKEMFFLAAKHSSTRALVPPCSDFALTLLLRECFQVPWTFIKLETFFKQFIPLCVEVE